MKTPLRRRDRTATYRELVRRGAPLVSKPPGREYGGIDAVFEDGCGDLLNLHEE